MDMQLSIKNAVAMLPPSPASTLKDFLKDVVNGHLIPAMCHVETRIETNRYWENRRVQNSLRRLLESLQERFESDESRTAEMSNKAFDCLLEWSQAHLLRRIDVNALDETAFAESLTSLNLWPAEMSMDDRQEVFLALVVRNAGIVRFLREGEPLQKEITRAMFSTGLTRVPYNIPDFPVPQHLLRPEMAKKPYSPHSVDEVAKHITGVFADQQKGLNQVKDFYLCGLVSLEEIQIALPALVPTALVDEAVMQIIRKSSLHIMPREWRMLVSEVRLSPDRQGEELVSARDPYTEQFDQMLDSPDFTDTQIAVANVTIEPPQGYVPEPLNESAPWASGGNAPPAGTQDEATPQIVTQETIDLNGNTDGLLELPLRRQPGNIVNWNTSRGPAAGSGGAAHQADEGAGTPQRGMNNGAIVEEAVSNMGAGRSTLSGDDPVAWISLEMMNECHGPYLALAFQRCCQIYEARFVEGDDDRVVSGND
jgi:hypothetical protein